MCVRVYHPWRGDYFIELHRVANTSLLKFGKCLFFIHADTESHLVYNHLSSGSFILIYYFTILSCGLMPVWVHINCETLGPADALIVSSTGSPRDHARNLLVGPLVRRKPGKLSIFRMSATVFSTSLELEVESSGNSCRIWDPATVEWMPQVQNVWFRLMFDGLWTC